MSQGFKFAVASALVFAVTGAMFLPVLAFAEAVASEVGTAHTEVSRLLGPMIGGVTGGGGIAVVLFHLLKAEQAARKQEQDARKEERAQEQAARKEERAEYMKSMEALRMSFDRLSESHREGARDTVHALEKVADELRSAYVKSTRGDRN